MAGIRAVRAYGPDLSVEQIASEAGTSRAVVYRYFSDKSDLYVAIGRRLADVFVARLTEAISAVDDPREQVSVAVDLYLRAMESEPELYQFTVRHPLLRRSDSQDPATTAGDVLAGFLSSRFGDQLLAGGGDSGAAEPWGYGLVGLVRTTGEWWLERGTMSRAALSHHLTSLIWGGLAVALPAPVAAPVEERAVRLVRKL